MAWRLCVSEQGSFYTAIPCSPERGKGLYEAGHKVADFVERAAGGIAESGVMIASLQLKRRTRASDEHGMGSASVERLRELQQRAGMHVMSKAGGIAREGHKALQLHRAGLSLAGCVNEDG